MERMQPDPPIAFVSRTQPTLEIRINFGVFAGRDVTPAEIDELAEALLPQVGEISIVAEQRHEIDARTEAAVHQVRIVVESHGEAVHDRLLAACEQWALGCVAERHAAVSEV
jgi:hypothetical protein